MTSRTLVWRELHWQRPLPPERALSVLRQWAADQRSPQLVLETRADADHITNLLGGPPPAVSQSAALLRELLPGTVAVPIDRTDPGGNLAAASVRSSTRHRPLKLDNPLFAVHALAAALHQVRGGEQLVVQVVLGPRRVPLAVGTNSPSSLVRPWWHTAWHGNGKTIDSEKRSALRTKVGDHGFACAVRLGVVAATPARRRALLAGVLGALRTNETAGLRLRLRPESRASLRLAVTPWRWPLRLNAQELLGLVGWPLGDDDLPGYAASHPRRLPPAPGSTGMQRVIADTPLAGSQPLALDARAALHHLHVIGPTGTGKSTLLANLILQDITDGRAVVVIEPKGDLVADVLARIPEDRIDDVVVLDPADSAPVGLNPLQPRPGRSADVAADAVLSVFRQLYGSAIGPRSADILHAGLLTLAARPDASLVMLPLLLTDAGFRRSLTAHIHDPIALGPFWASYEAWSAPERAAAIAPVMNKLRPLLRPGVRAVLGQRRPRFQISQVFTERKVLLVPLSRGLLGPEAASIIGSLVVAELWQATLARTSVPAERRHPVSVFIDEVQDYLHISTDLSDAMAQARGLGVGLTLAHQMLGQLPTEMREAVLTNARSRVAFQLGPRDAAQLVHGRSELDAADFTSLGSHQVYASLFAHGRVTPYAFGLTRPLPPDTTDPNAVRAASRMRFGRSLDEIEAGFAELLTPDPVSTGPIGRRRRSTS